MEVTEKKCCYTAHSHNHVVIKVVYEDSIVDTIYDKNGEIKEIRKQEGRPKPDLLIMNERKSQLMGKNSV